MIFPGFSSLSGIQWDIILIIALCPLYNASLGSYGVFQLLIAPLLLLYVYYKTKEKRKYKLSSKSYIIIYIAMLIQDAFLTLAFGQKDLFQEMKVHIIVLLVMLHPICLKTTKIIYPLMAIVGTIVGYYMLKNQDVVAGVRLSLQIGDVLQDPNWIAIFLFAPFCFGLGLLKDGQIVIKVIGLLLIALSFYVVFLTGSRGALIGLCTAYLIWLRTSLKQTKLSNVIFGLVAISLLTYFFVSYYISNVDIRIIDRYNGNDTESEEIRRDIWHDLIVEFFNGDFFDIIIGRGPASCVRDLGHSAHNMFLEYLFQYGLVGFLLVVVFVTKLVKDTIRCNNIIGLSLLAALFSLSLTTPIWGQIYFMISMAMVVYVNNSITLQSKIQR